MNPNHQTKRQALSICLLTLLITSAAAIFSAMPSAQAAAIPINVIGADSVSHPISDIATLTQTVGSGGYKNNQDVLYWGNYKGISLLTLCNSIGTALTSNQNVTVTTSGGSGTNITFNYDQVANGLSISPQYNTYSNITGTLTAQTQPVTLLVAYQFINGTKIPGSSTTRLLIVGPEGLLFDGTGLAGVENITITNNPASPTPTPTAVPTNAASTPTATTHATAKPTATPTTQPTPTPNATATASPTPPEITAPSSDMTFTYPIIILVVVVIVIAVVAVALSRRHHA
jgi:hypothetical protein